MAPLKIAVIGDVNGEFEKVFAKLTTLHSKTHFDLAIVVGNLFSESPSDQEIRDIENLIHGRINVPLSTYFALARFPFPDKVKFKLDETAGELCTNLSFLGRKTTTKTADGLRLVSLGGKFDPEATTSKDQFSEIYADAEAASLKGAQYADILITSEWPENIDKGSKVLINDHPNTALSVAELCSTLKPKYHFSTSPSQFYEREPFVHVSEAKTDGFKVTRFISLAQFGNLNKQKWIYAFSLDPLAGDLLTIPTGSTTTPLLSKSNKRSQPSSDQNSVRFSSAPSHHTASRPRKRPKNQPRPGPEDCFFCLSNPNVAAHMITSIGTESYLATAKGPLPLSSTFPTLPFPFPAHMLIIPLAHTPTIAHIADPVARTALTTEMTLFRTALHSMLLAATASGSGGAGSAGSSATPPLGSVTWSVSRASGIHAHWQWMPIEPALLDKDLVAAAYAVEAEHRKYAKLERCAHMDLHTGGADGADGTHSAVGDSFQVTWWDGRTGREGSLVLPLDEGSRFDVQFSRTVLAKLLRLDERADWRVCGQSREEEDEDVRNFKKAFEKFDFTLDS